MAIFDWLVLKGFLKKLKQTKLSICDLILNKYINIHYWHCLENPKAKYNSIEKDSHFLIPLKSPISEYEYYMSWMGNHVVKLLHK